MSFYNGIVKEVEGEDDDAIINALGDLHEDYRDTTLNNLYAICKLRQIISVLFKWNNKFL